MRNKKDTKLEGSIRAGRFSLQDDKDIVGTLTFAGTDTYLRLDHDSHFNSPHEEHFDVHGEFLEDRRKISLLSCVTSMGLGTHSGPDIKTTYYAEVEPGLVLVGKNHVSYGEKAIQRVFFLVDDAPQLFYDFEAFGVLVDPKPYIEVIANANKKWLAERDEVEVKGHVETGAHPAIAYFTGNVEIVSADSALGRVVVENQPTVQRTGVEEIHIKNHIYISIAFPEPVDIKEATWRATTLVRFLELCAGRPQNMLDLRIQTTMGEHDYMEVYWPRRPSRKAEGELREKPWAGEVLLDPIRRREEYVKVLPAWLGRHKEWEESRMHFVSCMHDQRVFGPDRITAAANMFDLLPVSAVPKKGENGKRLILKEKILRRAKLITDRSGKRFPEFDTVIDEAVKCRKRYVHGTKGSINYPDHFGVVVFLTQTLEFIFAASDLIDCGWDVEGWLDSGLGGQHPLREYVFSYQMQLAALKKAIAEHQQNDDGTDSARASEA